jgi:hypothetical protein
MSNTANSGKKTRNLPQVEENYFPPATPPPPPAPAPRPVFIKSSPIDIPGAKARQAAQRAQEVIIENTPPSRSDSDYYLYPGRLPSRPLDTTKIIYSLAALAVTAPAPISRPVTPEISEDPIKDLFAKELPQGPQPFCGVMSVLLTTGKWNRIQRT